MQVNSAYKTKPQTPNTHVFSLDLSFNARLRALPLTSCNLTRLHTLLHTQVPFAFPPPAVIKDGTPTRIRKQSVMSMRQASHRPSRAQACNE
jgi:hypothetical protein